jgi:hypothetical protein
VLASSQFPRRSRTMRHATKPKSRYSRLSISYALAGARVRPECVSCSFFSFLARSSQIRMSTNLGLIYSQLIQHKREWRLPPNENEKMGKHHVRSVSPPNPIISLPTCTHLPLPIIAPRTLIALPRRPCYPRDSYCRLTLSTSSSKYLSGDSHIEYQKIKTKDFLSTIL